MAIKKIYFSFLLFLPVTILCAQTTASWGIILNTTTEELHDISAPTATTCYICGFGLIKKSVDGGQTWTNQSSGTSGSFTSIFFTDSINGYAVGQWLCYTHDQWWRNMDTNDNGS